MSFIWTNRYTPVRDTINYCGGHWANIRLMAAVHHEAADRGSFKSRWFFQWTPEDVSIEVLFINAPITHGPRRGDCECAATRAVSYKGKARWRRRSVAGAVKLRFQPGVEERAKTLPKFQRVLCLVGFQWTFEAVRIAGGGDFSGGPKRSNLLFARVFADSLKTNRSGARLFEFLLYFFCAKNSLADERRDFGFEWSLVNRLICLLIGFAIS
jgi:hypothetical protein